VQAVVSRPKRTERDLRSLDRKSMYSIFPPLDDKEPALGDDGFKARNNMTSAFAPDMDDPMWKTLLTWLWVPALIVFLSLEEWLSLPQLTAWLLAIGFMVLYAALGWFAYRKKRRR
jgi:hypothetical protein